VTSAAATLPALPVIARALRETTERLAHELASCGAAAPEWSDFEWDMARVAAAVQGIGPLLARRLAWRGPDRWRQFLDEQLWHGLRRAERIESLCHRIDQGTRHAGIAVIALKGAALLRRDMYGPGERPMGDIDLLVRPDDRDATGRVMEALGYHHQFTNARHAVFSDAPPMLPRGIGEHEAHPLKIEVHTAVADPIPVTSVDITAHLWPHDPHPGINAYPDDGALLLHLLLHAAGNMRAHALRLIQLEDIGRLTRRLPEAHWPALPWWGLPPLQLAIRYCGAIVPSHGLTLLERSTTQALRRAAARYTLTDVSWSNLRISAFPGIEWSRSIGEALRYMRTRVAPSREARAQLQTAEYAQPAIGALPWYGLSHSRRLLRWLSGRAPRVQPMVTVLAALGGDQSLQRARTPPGLSASSR